MLLPSFVLSGFQVDNNLPMMLEPLYTPHFHIPETTSRGRGGRERKSNWLSLDQVGPAEAQSSVRSKHGGYGPWPECVVGWGLQKERVWWCAVLAAVKVLTRVVDSLEH